MLTARRLTGIVFTLGLLMVLGGCVSQEQYNELKAQNRLQQNRITNLEGELANATRQLEQMQKQLALLQGQSNADATAKNAEMAALLRDIEGKKALIASLQAQLMRGGVALPAELNTMLEEFAANNSNIVSYDNNTGMLRFKSDLLFDTGSDVVTPQAAESLKVLCQIMNSEGAKKFDLLVAGHTDDMRISKPATREKHPTNWYLSAHRAISVLDILTVNNIAPERVSIRGFGEYRPAEPNKPNKAGNAANRRVEIYVVPSGT